MKHFLFIIMLLLKFATFLAQGSNHDCMQGVWKYREHCEKHTVFCRIEFRLIHDDEILCLSFDRMEHWQYQKGGWKLISIQEFGEGRMLVDQYQFLLVNDEYKKRDDLPKVFWADEVEDINSNTMALFHHDRNELNLREDSIVGITPTLCSIKCTEDSMYWDYIGYTSSVVEIKRIDNDSIPSYLSDGIFNYSLTSKRDYYQEFFGKTVGVIKESEADKDTTSKKGRICITEENESSYYVKPLGSSDVKEGWVNKKDVKLLREMIRN